MTTISTDGEWVLYSDYTDIVAIVKELEAERDRLNAEVKRLSGSVKLLEDISYWVVSPILKP